MKSLLISDLHSNFEAFSAVLKKVQRKRFDRIVCLGDFVGYGAQPNQLLDRLRALRGEKVFIRGNHDRVAAGIDDGSGFNHVARVAALWNRDHLSKPNRKLIETLPAGPLPDRSNVLLCHGSPYDEDEYIFSDLHAAEILQRFNHRVIFFGHTHFPVVFTLASPRELYVEYVKEGGSFRLDPDKRYLINPGSVGQPRDRNPHASFALFDDERWTIQFFRVPYDIPAAQTAILRAGLPRILADRLAVGT